MPRTPTPRRPGKPYRVLYSLLYARFAWAERGEDGSLRANTAQFARALGLRTHSLRESLYFLKERGDLDRLVWHRGWFLAQPRCPVGLSRLVGPAGGSPEPRHDLTGLVESCPEVIDV